ncbi:hypothetical protein T440DRAFT_470978 [Plenodomus tracheiphilus IPT5]|uniref:Uncharacterized protein n=1 Tax=Plenodomus tracheiphilus IPT5 TaxID=1408161 RepID=A0A6A7AXD0_9PLEO|nr:hypothetical protein T440DRAFT_470978 [Plenodomus tracheiphilus IPT5]
MNAKSPSATSEAKLSRGPKIESLSKNDAHRKAKGSDQEKPARQPTVPPSVEALRSGEAQNFARFKEACELEEAEKLKAGAAEHSCWTLQK